MYLIGILVIIVGLTAGIIMEGAEVAMLLKLSGLMIVLVGAVGAWLATNPSGLGKAIKDASLKKEKEISSKSFSLWQAMERASIVMGIVGTLIGFMHVLSNIGSANAAQLGFGFALSLVSTIYGLLFGLFFYFLKIRVKQNAGRHTTL